MEPLSEQTQLGFGPPRRGRGWWFVRSSLIATAFALSLASSAMLLAGAWGAPEVPSAGAANEQLALGASTPDVFAERLAALAPSATPSLTPTATSTPKPTQPAPPPEQVSAPQSEPGGPPPALPTATPQPPAAVCPTSGISGYALGLFNAINAARAEYGMGSLAADGCATYVAQIRSDDMASRGYFSHTSPDGSTTFSLLDAYGVPHGWAGENLARNNYPDSETVAVSIRDLMASDSHRANILSGNYSALGVAVAFDGAGMKYFTMVFIGPPV